MIRSACLRAWPRSPSDQEGAGNVTIREVLEGLQARVTSLRAASLAQPQRRSLAEIRAIVQALEARDAERAAAASVNHVNQAARTIRAAMGASGAAHSEAS